jgi:RHH-type transcriptional regulator, proline utilization regulon repressor / proline dehydrogenase / delta 1-pyrroline-5-carboxylate dehydrogenase
MNPCHTLTQADFSPVAPTDFVESKERDSFLAAIFAVERAMSSGELVATPIINGKRTNTPTQRKSLNPSNPQQVVGTVHYASKEDAIAAIEACNEGRAQWKTTPAEARAAILTKAAAEMDKRRHPLAALIVLESGKPWKEADADVVEAIDFCNYYAACMLKMARPQKTQDVLGEDNFYSYHPRGVAAVIAPWNFPLAIACGMFVAALVTGNTAILKPAEQTSLIAAVLVDILMEAGLPPYAFAFLPGEGETVGATLVDHAMVDVICFTGSKAVGLEIIKKAATIAPQQRSIKKVIAEMGGKNAIIVDEDADLDEAIKGILYSGFAFAGQKCSACSRVIVVGTAYQQFLKRFTAAAADITIGAAKEPGTFIGPVIDGEAQSRIMAAIATAEKESKLAFKGNVPTEGYFTPAVVFFDVESHHSVWRAELFAPVLAVRQASSIEQAIALANESEYKLTGGLFSRSPRSIALVKQEFEVGNLYINRACTGALVQRQPFGGFGMSGVGAKAGGPDYLLQFVEARTMTENTMRRGMAPEFT